MPSMLGYDELLHLPGLAPTDSYGLAHSKNKPEKMTTVGG